MIGPDQTATAVELDQIFDLFDQRDADGLQDFFKGSARCSRTRQGAPQGVHYLNPALSTGARLFQELTRDDALLERFLVDSRDACQRPGSAPRRPHRVVRNLDATFGALGSQQDALAESVERLPPFMRRAEHHVREPPQRAQRRGPVRRRRKARRASAGPVPRPGAPVRARRRADHPRPVADDHRPGPRNDLIELIRSFPPLAHSRSTASA